MNIDQQHYYFHGDLAVYTGKTIFLHGAFFYEIRLLEGRLKGQTKVVSLRQAIQNAPVESAGQTKPGEQK